MENLVKSFQDKSENIAFKVIIDGRAANNRNQSVNNGQPWKEGDAVWKSMEVVSYQRARAVRDLWKSRGIFSNKDSLSNVDVIISGSGFGGKGRYVHYRGCTEDMEAKNKTFIIQIIPYINF